MSSMRGKNLFVGQGTLFLVSFVSASKEFRN